MDAQLIQSVSVDTPRNQKAFSTQTSTIKETFTWDHLKYALWILKSSRFYIYKIYPEVRETIFIYIVLIYVYDGTEKTLMHLFCGSNSFFVCSFFHWLIFIWVTWRHHHQIYRCSLPAEVLRHSFTFCSLSDYFHHVKGPVHQLLLRRIAYNFHFTRHHNKAASLISVLFIMIVCIYVEAIHF